MLSRMSVESAFSATVSEVSVEAPAAGVHASVHAPEAVVMVRPHRARPNAAECADNTFTTSSALSADAFAAAVHAEVGAMAEALRAVGVDVLLFEDEGDRTPDSMFPNNWLTTHADGTIGLHSMRAPSRQLEPRLDIVAALQERYAVTAVVDQRHHAAAGRHLEGTGVMVIDHDHDVAYVGRSARTCERLLDEFCREVGLTAVAFDTADRHGLPIYHTNVMMALGRRFALVCLDLVPDADERALLVSHLEAGGREVIELSIEQVENFAGNALEVRGRDGHYLVMSRRGIDTLTLPQRHAIEASATLLPVDIATIEHGGGSARCMLAGIHLPHVASAPA